MLKNRILLCLFILCSTILVSFYGGNISYALFYFSLFLPIGSIIYTFYVYQKFKFYQKTETKILVKKESCPYFFSLGNENRITFTKIKVEFDGEKSKIVNLNKDISYKLEPNDEIKVETQIICNYRGEYFVGAENFIITDYLNLFNVKYKVPSKLPVTVLPRIIDCSYKDELFDATNEKKALSMDSDELEYDSSVRTYEPGDSLKHINWKATAKSQKLMTREIRHISKNKNILIMDLKNIEIGGLNKVFIEDEIIEQVISIVNHCINNKIPCNVVYDNEMYKDELIRNGNDFEGLYRLMGNIKFKGKKPVEEVLLKSMESYGSGQSLIIVTSQLSEKLYFELMNQKVHFSKTSIVYVNYGFLSKKEEYIATLKKVGINTIIIDRSKAGDEND